jgi:hypothetical protein
MPPPIMVVVGLGHSFDLVLLSIAIVSIHIRCDGACFVVRCVVRRELPRGVARCGGKDLAGNSIGARDLAGKLVPVTDRYVP